ncbi:hypothetical protein HZS_4856, partial [Henneguya salminicola]
MWACSSPFTIYQQSMHIKSKDAICEEASFFEKYEREFQLRPINIIDQAFIDFRTCKNPNKINLTLGIYKQGTEDPYYFNVIKMAEQLIFKNKKRTKGYLDAHGVDNFNNLVASYFLKDNTEEIKQGRMNIIQTLSATGAISVTLNLIKCLTNVKEIYTSNYYYPLYDDIFSEVKELKLKIHPYYDIKTNTLMFEDLIYFIKNCSLNSIILFNTCAHNPTGTDMNFEQWNQFSDIIKSKNIILIMDSAYLGFITGDPYKDFYPVRMLISKNIEFFATISFSKCLGLYSERIGCLIYRTNSIKVSQRIFKKAEEIISAEYMCPPKHGAELVSEIISNPNLIKEWKKELKMIVERLKQIRKDLYSLIKSYKIPGDWSRIINQQGFFIFLNIDGKLYNKSFR